jgi:hypothetical protein
MTMRSCGPGSNWEIITKGSFEGQIGASECLSEPVPACVS